ncbi:MAG TPA: Hsp20/alpha crystallin family protein [Methanocorpusculum sp.]|nr:Hsp20/alpha crystallin family protein [Candidatus Methanocorpusculum faecipullorum]HJK07512.1 Hsp20/alpha crystallin family protein [Methanocorpusculum sp.]HJK09506.1 Hsp20/alpha crystallin family protein [Methanocorpusculum sp.]HJK10871.1 Hsp20/alpha crystallin family protein [Methanocorpusculum sp.]HJK14220.1 Hsp20/alpha crystallin family protein [Methanocorpusculum sp.]
MSIRPYQFSFTSLGSELDSLFAEMEARATALMNQSGASTLPAAVKSGNYSVFGNDFHVDLCENENEIIVVTDLPGVEKENISVKLLNPETLMIKTEQQIQTEEGTEGTYHLRERRLGSMQRNIHLPAPVKAEGAKASFKNGVMEITLQKEVAEEGTTIAIE